MKLCLILNILALSGVPFCGIAKSTQPMEPADLIIYNAKVVTVNSNFTVAQAIAVRGERIVAIGKDKQVEALKGPATRLIDAHGTTVMPGLQDGGVSSYAATMSDSNASVTSIHSIAEGLDYIRQQAATQKSTNSWIVVRRAFPTRLKEGRLPTKAELDEAAPKHPVFWNSGALTVLNTRAFVVAKINSQTKVPPGGEIVLDAATKQPTGILRNAASLVKFPPVHPPTPAQRREALKLLHQHYNEQGITSIVEERAEPEAIDLFRELSLAGELSVRIRCARWIEAGASPAQNLERLNALTNVPAGKLPYAPSGVGDDWVRIGPLITGIDGDVPTGTAYLRSPWGIGPTYGNVEPSYRGGVKANTENLTDLFMQATARGWQVGADCTGDAALDELLNCFQKVQFKSDISQRRFLVSHATFQAQEDWARCHELGVVASSEPLGLYYDGASLSKTLGEKRLKNYLAYKTWFDNGLTISADSGENVNPWLGLWTTLSRTTEPGAPVWPEQILSREQAIRLYTINNAYVNFDERNTGSLEVGKLADLILIDKDLLKCPLGEVRETKVRLTVVGGKIVWEAK